MILKASQRGGAKQLAQHLLSGENEHVSVHDVSGFMAQDVEGALQEIYAISRGTKCKKFLFSVSLSPPQNELVPVQDFEEAITKIENKLKLNGQPHVVVFHEKEGRRHAHCVWSRINTDEMKAIKLDYFKKDLNAIAKDLYLQHNWEMPKGFLGKSHNDPRNFTLKEWQQAKRNNLNPKHIKAELQACWKHSDDKKSFTSALTNSGFFLAKGDRRGFVAVDWHGEVYSLSRSLGVKSKNLKQRLGEPDKLPTVEATKAIISTAQSELHTRLLKELALRQKHEAKPLTQKKAELVKEQRIARASQHKQQEARQQQERDERQAKYRKGLSGLWDRLSGKHYKLKKRHERTLFANKERDWQQKEQLIKAQIETRQALQRQLDVLKSRHQKEAMALNAGFVKTLRGQELQGELKRHFTNSLHPERQKPMARIKPELGV